MANNFQYVDTEGQMQTVQATSAEEAQRIAPNIASTSGVMAVKPPQSIPANDIQSTEPVSVPSVPPQSSGQTIDAIAQESAQRAAQAQEAFDKSRSSLEDRIKEITTVMGSREDLEREQGLDQANLDVADIQNQIRAREHSLRRAIEDTQRTAGLSGTQIARRVSALERDAARELADLSIIENARLNRAEAISNNIDRKINAQLEPLAFQLQFDKMFYEENRDAMSAAQREMFDIKILREQRNYDEQAAEKQSIKDIAIAAAQFGATGEQIVAITDAKNFNEAMQVGGSFLGEGFRMQVQAQEFNQYIQQAQLNMAWSQMAQAKEAAAASLEMEARKMSREDIDLARKDTRVTNFETIQSVKNRVDQELNNVTTDEGRINWEAAAKSNSTIWAISNAAARSQNPEMARLAGDLGLDATAGALEKAEATYRALTKDQTALPSKMREMYNLLDSSHTSAMRDMQDALTSLQTTVPGFTITEDMFVNRDVTADNFVNAAIQNINIMNAPRTGNDAMDKLLAEWRAGR
jgi:hypothetical protein